MKFDVNVQLYDRTLFCQRKPQRSLLSFVKKRETGDVYLLWQTRMQKEGTKYLIFTNLHTIHNRYLDRGSLSLAFHNPSHNLLIQGDKILLKKFNCLITHVYKGHDMSDENCIPEFPLSFILTAKREVVIRKKSEYPTLKGFPLTTEKLYIGGLDKKSFDRQILTLQTLRTLNLENNKISHLPRELGALPHLEKLVVSGNHLGKATLANNWAWMEQIAASKCLRELDISNNQITALPIQIAKLWTLTSLNVSQNLLQSLPQAIGDLIELRNLDLSKNKLLCLPGTMKSMNLERLDISSNAFRKHASCRPCHSRFIRTVPRLVDLTAAKIIRNSIPYKDVLPALLVKYIDNANLCYTCKRPCFGLYIKQYFTLLDRIHRQLFRRTEIIRDRTQDCIQFECYFCCYMCSMRFHYW